MPINKSLPLISLTIIFLLISGLSIYKGFFENRMSHLSMDESDLDRNESSTPRAFVLPSTPAVAEAQESKQRFIERGLDSDKCLSKLKDLGYPIDDLNSSFNAKYIEAIINFQKNKSIPVTGDLDQLTIKILGC